MTLVRSYGVKERVPATNEISGAVESLKLLGYAVLSGGYSNLELDELSARFDQALERNYIEHGGIERLAELDEHRTIRALLTMDPAFLDVARNSRVLATCEALIGNYFILNQQNGIINPPNKQPYGQGAWHRDLPYQHFVSSRPLALNALFCLDPFTSENGATMVLPATHKQELFPSDHVVSSYAHAVTAERGSFLILDAMLFHSGGPNGTPHARRAINHLYTIPLLRQQIDIPAMLGAGYSDDPVLGRFLGYNARTPRSVQEYYMERRARLRPSQ